MAECKYQNVSGDWTAAANWQTAAAPVAADHVFFWEGTKTIDTNLPGAAAGVNYQSMTVGPNFAGNIGTVTNKLYVGSVVGNITIDGTRMGECWLISDAADTSVVIVNDTGASANALHLFSGTFTPVYCRRAGFLRIGAGATVTNLFSQWLNDKLADSHIHVESGATLTNAYILGGTIDCYAAVATLLRMGDGVWNHLGDANFNVATLDLWGGTFNFNSEGGTITTANVYGGLLDATGGIGGARVITNLNRYGGVVDKRGATGSGLTITNDNKYGGTLLTDE